MKKIMIMLLGAGISLGAFAGIGGPRGSGGVHYGGGHTTVIISSPYGFRSSGFGYGYNPFYSPYYAYNPFYSPYGYRQQPSKLDFDIAQINNNYHHDIAGTRHDKSLSRADRKAKIRDLRNERENSVLQAQNSYYHPRRSAQSQSNDPATSVN